VIQSHYLRTKERESGILVKVAQVGLKEKIIEWVGEREMADCQDA
jgi:hypothetical protein